MKGSFLCKQSLNLPLPSVRIIRKYQICAKTGEPVFLTKDGEGDLVVMNISAYDQRVRQLELREKLVEIEETRKTGVPDISAHLASDSLRSRLRENANV